MRIGVAVRQQEPVVQKVQTGPEMPAEIGLRQRLQGKIHDHHEEEEIEHRGIEGLTNSGCSLRVVMSSVSVIHHDWLIEILTAQSCSLAASPINSPYPATRHLCDEISS